MSNCCTAQTHPEPCSSCKAKISSEYGLKIQKAVFLYLDVPKIGREKPVREFMMNVDKKDVKLPELREKFSIALKDMKV